MKKILVIQQKMIGDVLVSSILCETLTRAWPNARVDYLIHETTCPVIKENAGNYRVVLFTGRQRKSRIEFLKFAKKIRNERYDLIIDAYSKLESWVIVAMSGAKKKISFKKGATDVLYTDLVVRHTAPISNLGLAIEHRLKLLEPLGIPKEMYVTHPKIDVSAQENRQAQAVLEGKRLGREAHLIVINILGSSASKTYPVTDMARIVDFLSQYNVPILFNYTARQAQQAQTIFGMCRAETRARVHLDVLNVDMRGFLALMNHCTLIIGNDGGAMHMAKALGKATFTIFSPWVEKKTWATFEDGHDHVSVHLQDFHPELFAGASQRQLRNKTDALYRMFRPEMMFPKLDEFCRRHLA